MSHFTRIRTKLRNPEYIRQAMKTMGHAELRQSGMVFGHDGHRRRVDLVFGVGDGQVGFKSGKGGYESVADWWTVGIEAEDFLGRLNREYALQAVMGETRKQGFSVQKTEKLKDGSVRVVVERWV